MAGWSGAQGPAKCGDAGPDGRAGPGCGLYVPNQHPSCSRSMVVLVEGAAHLIPGPVRPMPVVERLQLAQGVQEVVGVQRRYPDTADELQSGIPAFLCPDSLQEGSCCAVVVDFPRPIAQKAQVEDALSDGSGSQRTGPGVHIKFGCTAAERGVGHLAGSAGHTGWYFSSSRYSERPTGVRFRRRARQIASIASCELEKGDAPQACVAVAAAGGEGAAVGAEHPVQTMKPARQGPCGSRRWSGHHSRATSNGQFSPPGFCGCCRT